MDGVILNSLDNLSSCLIKAVEPFCQSDRQYQMFSKFDKENPGLSRFEKTDFFLESLPNISHIKTERIKQQILDQLLKWYLLIYLHCLDHYIYQIKK
jgi:hypothetical protein